MGCNSQRMAFYAVPQARARAVAVTGAAPDSSAFTRQRQPVLAQMQVLRLHQLAAPRSQHHRQKSTIPAMHFPKPNPLAKPAATSNKQAAPPSTTENRPLNGVLLLVPVLALLALAGVSLAVAGIFSIGFWAAFGWTTLVVVGGLLLALAIAILRGK
jgi:hypothetical protein